MTNLDLCDAPVLDLQPAPLMRTMASLKLTILRNSIFGAKSRSWWSIFAMGVTLAGSLFTAISIAMTPSTHTAAASAERLTLLLTSVFGLWVFGPLLVGGVDDSLDPTRLALLPLRRSELRKGLVIGALLGPLPLGTVITLTGIVVGFHPKSALSAFTVVAVFFALIANLTLSRALSVSLAFAGRSRRGKDLSILLASLGAAALFLGTQSLRFLSDGDKARILKSLRWLPSGQVAQAVLEIQRGAIAQPLIRLSALAIICALGFTIWLRGIDRLLVDPDAIRHVAANRSSDVHSVVPNALRRWVKHPTVVLASKELRYLARSPQRRSSLIISIVIGTVFALLQSMRFATSNPNAVFGAVVAALFGVHATNNVLGTDAASLWMEQTAGVRLKDQLIARSAAACPNLLIPVVLAALVLATMSGGWKQFVVLCAATLALIGLPLGVGSVISVVAPFNQPDSSNPHSNKRANNGKSGLISLLAVVGIAAVVVGAAPPFAAMAIAWILGSKIFLALAIVLTVPYSAFCWWLGVKLAMRFVRDRETELLSSIGGRRASV
jgi:ABC-2 type transport system permease protein